MTGLVVLGILSAPNLALGYFRNFKVGLAFVVASLGGAVFYQWFDGGEGPGSLEWGAQFAPVFFLMLSVALLIAFTTGWLARVTVEKLRSNRTVELESF